MKIKLAVAFTCGTLTGVVGVLYTFYRCFAWICGKLFEQEEIRIATKDIVHDIVAEGTEKLIFGESARSRRRTHPHFNYRNYASRSADE